MSVVVIVGSAFANGELSPGKTSGLDVDSNALAADAVLANELEIPCAALVVGHKPSRADVRAGDQAAIAKSLDDAREAPGVLDGVDGRGGAADITVDGSPLCRNDVLTNIVEYEQFAHEPISYLRCIAVVFGLCSGAERVDNRAGTRPQHPGVL